MEKRILSLFAAAAIILSVLPGCGAQYPGFSEEVSNAPEALSAYIHDSIDALAELGIDISDNEEEITGEIIDLFGDPASCSDGPELHFD